MPTTPTIPRSYFAADAALVSPSGDVRDALEQERLRLAHDLHDELGSLLIAIKLAMSPLLAADAAGATDAASRADRLLDQAIGAMHRVLHDLRPPELDLGLVAALQKMADDYRLHALPCHFSSNQAEIDAAPEVTLGLLRICREALTNVSKHADAGEVVLRLTQQAAGAGGETLLLDIIDDGRGYPADAPPSASIARRVRALGGTLERRTGSDHGRGSGCHLHIRIPILRPAGTGSR